MFLSTCYTEISKKFQNLVDFGVIWLILRCFNGFGFWVVFVLIGVIEGILENFL